MVGGNHVLQSNPELPVYKFQHLRQYHHISTHLMQLFKRYFSFKKQNQKLPPTKHPDNPI